MSSSSSSSPPPTSSTLPTQPKPKPKPNSVVDSPTLSYPNQLALLRHLPLSTRRKLVEHVAEIRKVEPKLPITFQRVSFSSISNTIQLDNEDWTQEAEQVVVDRYLGRPGNVIRTLQFNSHFPSLKIAPARVDSMTLWTQEDKEPSPEQLAAFRATTDFGTIRVYNSSPLTTVFENLVGITPQVYQINTVPLADYDGFLRITATSKLEIIEDSGMIFVMPDQFGDYSERMLRFAAKFAEAAAVLAVGSFFKLEFAPWMTTSHDLIRVASVEAGVVEMGGRKCIADLFCIPVRGDARREILIYRDAKQYNPKVNEYRDDLLVELAETGTAQLKIDDITSRPGYQAETDD